MQYLIAPDYIDRGQQPKMMQYLIAPDYIDDGQTAYMGSPGRGLAGAKNDLKNSLDKFDDFSYVIEANDFSFSFARPYRYILERITNTENKPLWRSAH